MSDRRDLAVAVPVWDSHRWCSICDDEGHHTDECPDLDDEDDGHDRLPDGVCADCGDGARYGRSEP